MGRAIWIKRDDLSGLAYGGNKLRKLELLLADARHRGMRDVITTGAMGSNHIVATGLFARQLGMRCHAVVVPQPESPEVRHNLALMRAIDVQLTFCEHRARVPLELIACRRRLARSYVVAPGGSSPLGTLGYVLAALELRWQVATGAIEEPEEIVVALGSGGTAAGLILGCAFTGLRCRVVGVRVVERALCNRALLRLLLRRTRNLMRRLGEPSPPPGDFVIDHDQYGTGYGIPTTASQRAQQQALELEGLRLDATYTAKSMAALLERSAPSPRSGRPTLFWHTYNGRDTTPLLG